MVDIYHCQLQTQGAGMDGGQKPGEQTPRRVLAVHTDKRHGVVRVVGPDWKASSYQPVGSNY